jgi:tetraacyldisaccharide 4'-kinase
MPEPNPWESWLDRIWYSGASGFWLRPLAALFGGIVRLRRLLYDLQVLRSERVAAPVLVVGNICVGGTGKTPLTVYLAGCLLALGRRPGIASRGYGSASRSARLVRPDSAAAEVGDEPLLLARRTGVPVCIARRRVEAARLLIGAGCDVILCDDGLQHLALARDIEIAVVDGARALGNGRMLPAGPLREAPSRLKCVDFVVVNTAPGDAVADAFPGALRMRLDGAEAVSLTGFFANRSLASFRGQTVHAVAAIGNPQRFFRQLRGAGIELIEHPYPDHHAFGPADLQFGDERAVLMTEKDAVKCAGFADNHHWFVPVEAVFDAADEARLMQCLSALPDKGELPQ